MESKGKELRFLDTLDAESKNKGLHHLDTLDTESKGKGLHIYVHEKNKIMRNRHMIK